MAQKPWCFVTIDSEQKVKIDKEDLERVSEHKWRITKGTTGRPRVVTSIREGQTVRSVTLGRYLMNPPRGKQVYPRRFNEGLDYRKDNLVVCTLSERQRLLPKKRVHSTSTYRGVSYSKTDGRWRAGIEVEGRSINLGHFESENDAAHAYNVAATKYFGDLAYQNQVGRGKGRRKAE